MRKQGAYIEQVCYLVTAIGQRTCALRVINGARDETKSSLFKGR